MTEEQIKLLADASSLAIVNRVLNETPKFAIRNREVVSGILQRVSQSVLSEVLRRNFLDVEPHSSWRELQSKFSQLLKRTPEQEKRFKAQLMGSFIIKESEESKRLGAIMENLTPEQRKNIEDSMKRKMATKFDTEIYRKS